MTPLITDAELLSLSLAANALNGIASGTRDEHRESASDYVRGQLAPRYSGILAAALDHTGVSHEIKMAIAAVAAYHLMSHKGFNPAKGSEAQIQARYDSQMKWLEQIKTYKAELVGGATLDRGAPLVATTGTSAWDNWRSGGNS